MSRHRPRREERGGQREDATLTAYAAQVRAEAVAVRRVSRRFEAALTRDAAEAGDVHDAGVLRRLRDEPITGIGRVVYSSNAVFVIEMEGADPDHPEEPLRAIYKPARGERPLWDFPAQTLHMREAAAYVVSAALRDGIVPPTTLRDGPHGPGSVQLYIHGPAEGTQPSPEAVGHQLQALAALDVLINNADRKRAHLLLGDDGRIRGIDNALSFLPYPRQRTVLIELGGRPLPDDVAGGVRELAGDDSRRAALRTELGRLIEHAEVTAFEERLDGLAALPVYPQLHPWDGRPFEWW